ncbi:MAG: hypothetical protein JF887_14330 [Candidatus Dormibacteraeota bacterium]|uniref:Uncharacterized protein n=1 Tax=Candidatus Amunia macphersoniae TaxID=3127014 RepID=A0A934NHJ1_9BACT|nr:hypothetical protein [Candidatus Dormibacteraeota bacterium]
MTQPTSHPNVFYTIDEARHAVIRSAAICLRGTAGRPPRLVAAILTGATSRSRWNNSDRSIAVRHRLNLDQVTAAGFGWVIDEELQGILSATGLDTYELHDIDLIIDMAGPLDPNELTAAA